MLPIKRSHPAGPLDEAIADIVGWTCCPFESEGKARIAVSFAETCVPQVIEYREVNRLPN